MGITDLVEVVDSVTIPLAFLESKHGQQKIDVVSFRFS